MLHFFPESVAYSKIHGKFKSSIVALQALIILLCFTSGARCRGKVEPKVVEPIDWSSTGF